MQSFQLFFYTNKKDAQGFCSIEMACFTKVLNQIPTLMRLGTDK